MRLIAAGGHSSFLLLGKPDVPLQPLLPLPIGAAALGELEGHLNGLQLGSSTLAQVRNKGK